MATILKRIRNEDEGVLTFEWILLITIVIIGIVGGLSAARDAFVDELGDVSEAVIGIDQSWTIPISANDPCQFDFGSYTDPQQTLTRVRPATPPISQ